MDDFFLDIRNRFFLLISIIKNSFKIVIKNPAITLILVLYFILSGILLCLGVRATTGIISLITTVGVILLCVSFLSGWFEVIKESTDLETIKDKKYFSIFLEGIGKNIVPVAIGSIIYIALLFSVLTLTSKIATYFFGSLEFIYQDLVNISNTNTSLIDYANNLSKEKMYTIYGWNMCVLLALSLYNFIFLFMFPAIVHTSKKNIFLRPFIGVFKGLCFIFKHFFGALFIYLIITFSYIFLNLLRLFMTIKVSFNDTLLGLFQFICIFITIYFLAFVVMLIFNYYEQKNNSSDRTDCIGENENCDKVSEEN